MKLTLIIYKLLSDSFGIKFYCNFAASAAASAITSMPYIVKVDSFFFTFYSTEDFLYCKKCVTRHVHSPVLKL